MAVDLIPLVDEGLGNNSYLVDLGDGRALAVDVSRDLRAVRAATRRRGLRVAFAAETHLHSDFLSGAVQLAATDGARVLASAAGERDFAHSSLRDGDEADLGGLRLRAMATPGHTHEHLSYLLLDGDVPVGVFTGGSLLVGAAARSDLVAPEETQSLARAQYASLRRLTRLADDVEVWPTHGAGSFCTAPAGLDRTSTIGREKATNPLLAVADEAAFVEAVTSGPGSYPPYFLWLPEQNRLGPPLLDAPPASAGLSASQTQRLLDDGAWVLDVRPVASFAAGHISGSVSIPLRPVFASWLGWLIPPGTRLIIVREPAQDVGEILWQAAKIGYDTIIGELAGGVGAWQAAGGRLAALPLADPAASSGRLVLDVRQRAEYAAGHVPGAVNVELGEFATVAADLPAREMLVMCGHGERAMSAASLLARAGHRDVTVLAGGPQDLAHSLVTA
ncbi:MAG: MBL fold metallo-hydrolase [Actinophytocola sp.]|nr:MBL fold metallo-hydrolase [Actinophytocola sp.]